MLSCRLIYTSFIFLLLIGNTGLAQDDGWGINGNTTRIPSNDLKRIGLTLCGPGKFHLKEDAVTCRICPDFTGNSGEEGDLTIRVRHIGQFSSAQTDKEWLLDTDGCEAHYVDFGGTVLLAEKMSKSSNTGLEKLFYKPGFRVDDCLIWATNGEPSQLVCNEVFTAQGESIGHISIMDINRRKISRWRLLRWYDNSGSIHPDIVSIFPLSMSRVTLKNGMPGLRIQLRKLIASRETLENGPVTSGQEITLEFQRRGRRFFATGATQEVIEEFSVLIRRMLN